MSFCPSCGTVFEAGQSFCRKCGYNLQLRLGAPQEPEIPPAPPGPRFTSKVYTMNADSVYAFSDEGISRYGTGFSLIAIPVILGAALGLVAAEVINGGSWVAMGVVFALILAPVVGEIRYRRLKREMERHGGSIIPWSSVQHMWVQGRSVTIRLPTGWTTATIDDEGSAALASGAPSILGGTFSTVPQPKPRFSPAAKFVLLTGAFFLLTQAILFAASFAPFFAGEQARYAALYNTVEQSVTGASLFQQWVEILSNNAQVALTSFVPGFGEFTLAASSYNTGRIIQVAAIHFNVSPADFLLTLYILPHSWVEELSYPMASALGIYGLAEWRRQSFKEFSSWKTRASTKISGGVAAVVLVLALAAFFEVTEPPLRIAGLLLWIPVGLGGAYAYQHLGPRIAKALS